MKCPKCGYLGFETSERCRNCGYDFSLSVQVTSPAELPLHDTDGAGAPLADFDLAHRDPSGAPHQAAGLDLDRLIGSDDGETSQTGSASATAGPPAVSAPVTRPPPAAPPPVRGALPLFSSRAHELDDMPLITAPRPARPPLSVRRTTPEIPRGRSRTRTTPPPDPPLELQLEPATDTEEPTIEMSRVVTPEVAAGLGARLLAAIVDLVLLAAIDAGVVYLTLAIAGLPREQASLIPRIPLAAFLVLMNGGYLVLFTAASGQTIGKMLTGIRVTGDDGRRVDIGGAMLRSVGCALSLLSAGLGYLPAFITADRRALQDRISGTRVVGHK